jgi:hypothetical protein
MNKTSLAIVFFLMLNNDLLAQTKVEFKDILSKNFDFYMISKDDNMPDINPYKDSLNLITILLHYGKKEADIRAYFKWSPDVFDAKLKRMQESDMIKINQANKAQPYYFVCSKMEAKEIELGLKNLVGETADSIQSVSKKIASEVAKIKAFRKISFKNTALLVLSDVLLDSWQIENVEQDFLKSPRTLRHGKHYYAAFNEKEKGSNLEPFGVYGNQYEDTLNYSMCRYGNARYTPEAVAKSQQLKKNFSQLKDYSRFKYPVLDSVDYKKLQAIADDFKPTLLHILETHRAELIKNYEQSIYVNQVSFEEYFIWVYHIYYTAVTDELIKRKIIHLPKETVAFYVVLNN